MFHFLTAACQETLYIMLKVWFLLWWILLQEVFGSLLWCISQHHLVLDHIHFIHDTYTVIISDVAGKCLQTVHNARNHLRPNCLYWVSLCFHILAWMIMKHLLTHSHTVSQGSLWNNKICCCISGSLLVHSCFFIVRKLLTFSFMIWVAR